MAAPHSLLAAKNKKTTKKNKNKNLKKRNYFQNISWALNDTIRVL